MILLKKKNVTDKTFGMGRRIGKLLLPVVEAASSNAHRVAQQLHREFSGKLHDHLVFLLSYRITVPSPFTS